ncbi:MAG TPA: hypothetical protein VJN95_07250 [Gemmatimonadales bacterium]|nr:hypothetical protein [Gemmatimonadales bacterium]
MNRPLGVTVIALLSILSGLAHLLKGLVVLGLGGGAAVLVGAGHPVAGGVIGAVAMVWGIIALIVAFFALLFGWGAWTLKPWAWSWGVFTEVMTLGWSLLAVLGFGTLRTQGLSILIAVAILLYLYSPEVKRAFGRGPGAS